MWFVSSTLLPFDLPTEELLLPLGLPRTIAVGGLGGFQTGPGNCEIEENHSLVGTQTSMFQPSNPQPIKITKGDISVDVKYEYREKRRWTHCHFYFACQIVVLSVTVNNSYVNIGTSRKLCVQHNVIVS